MTSAPFRNPEIDFEGGALLSPEWVLLLSNLVRALAVLLGLFAFGRFIVRPVLGSLPAAERSALPARVGDLEAGLAVEGGLVARGELAAGGERALTLAEQVGGAAVAQGEDSVKTIRSWLNQG